MATFIGIGVIMIGFRDAWDQLFDVMNTTTTLSGLESIVWRFAPIAIPIAAVIGGILVLVRRRDNRREGVSEWRD